MIEIGFIGLPNVGKSTIFSLLTKISVPIENFPFTTIEPNVGVVEVPDEKLDFIADHLPHEKKTYATIKYVDIAGLIKGASKGEGLGNRFLANIREVDGIVHVLRFFNDETVSSSINKIDPIEEIEIINTELLLADIEMLERYLSKLESKTKIGDIKVKERFNLLIKLVNFLNKTNKISEIKNFIEYNILNKDTEVDNLLKNLLTPKDRIFLLNYDEKLNRKDLESKVLEIHQYTGYKVLSICAKFELNLLYFSKKEQIELRKEYNIPDEEIRNFIRESVTSLNLITFYTIVGKEFRAWFIKKGTTVLDAAGKIHSDMRGRFINAEVLKFEDFKATPDIKLLHQNGKIKVYGKDYIVEDGDIIKINFH